MRANVLEITSSKHGARPAFAGILDAWHPERLTSSTHI